MHYFWVVFCDQREPQPIGPLKRSKWTPFLADDKSVRTSHTAQYFRFLGPEMGRLGSGLFVDSAKHRLFGTLFHRPRCLSYVCGCGRWFWQRKPSKFPTLWAIWQLISLLDIHLSSLLRSACSDCAKMVLGTSSCNAVKQYRDDRAEIVNLFDAQTMAHVTQNRV